MSDRDGNLLVVGIDVGTSSVKVAVMNSPDDGAASVRAKVVERIRRRDPITVVKHCYALALEAADVSPEWVDYVASTGEGHLVEFRRGHFFGMTAHARGASYLCPGASGALDIGALHARAIRMDERSRVLGYCMTSQCASGTGQFVENIARYLGVTLAEVGPLSLQSSAPEKVSGICAVLAETDVINMVSRGIGTGNILRGIHQSMADRLVKLLRSAKISGTAVLTGGLATDVGLRAVLDEQLRGESRVKVAVETHPDAIYAGAIGAALWGGVRHRRLQKRSPAPSPEHARRAAALH